MRQLVNEKFWQLAKFKLVKCHRSITLSYRLKKGRKFSQIVLHVVA